MAENLPGVYVDQTIIDDTVNTISAELPTCVVGPLYEVLEFSESDTNFDALDSANQSFSWPNKRVGAVVDLSATRGGYIDSQRKDSAVFPFKVYLQDSLLDSEPTSSDIVSDSDIVAIDQDGFELKQTARSGRSRGTFSVWALSVNNEQFIYKPSGGLSVVKAGDRVAVGAVDTTVSSVTSTKIVVEDNIAASLSSGTRVAEDQAGTVTLSSALSATPGRVVFTITGSDFISEVATLAVGDAIVSGYPLAGFDELEAQVSATLTVLDNVDFGVNITEEEIDNWIIRLDFYDADSTYTTLVQTSFATVTGIDTVAGTLTMSGAIAGAVENDYVKVSILKGVVGYIESINSPTNTQLTVIVPETFSDTRTFIDIYPTEQSITPYPDMNVYVTYRQLRKDLADEAFSASSVDEFLSITEHASVHINDGIGYAAKVATLAQPEQRPVFFIPVDLEPDDGDTGLPDNHDYATGYQNALEAAQSVSVYTIVCLDQDKQEVKDALKSHVDSMSVVEEGQWRRGFFYSKLPLGEVESSTGLWEPGRVIGGIASSATSGNKYLKDPNVAFVTDGEVVAGTKIVVTYPAELAGEYTATGDTTDDFLVLDGAVWDLEKEFAATPINVNTVSGEHILSGAAAGTWVHVEAGDYVEFTESAVRYRLRVEAVNTAGTQLTCSDEVAGTLDFGTGNSNNGTNSSVIRSWSNVQYHIDPLTRQQRVDKAIAQKTLNGRRYSLFLDQSPTTSDGVLSPEYALIAVAAKRSGLSSYQDITNLALGGGITSVKHGYNVLKRSQIKSLAQNGIVFLEQKDRDAEPIIVDMLTSRSGGGVGLVETEEMITANADWISKTLKTTFLFAPGAQLNNITPRLLGVRAMQIDAILKKWVSEGRLVGYRLRKLEQNATNKRRIDICITLVMPVAEKEIYFELEVTV